MSKKEKLKKEFDKFINDESVIRLGNNIPSFMQHTKRQDASLFLGIEKHEKVTSGVIGNNISEETIYIGKPQDQDGHVLVVGGAGSGNSSCIAMPTLETWGGTIFAVDIKGELSGYWSQTEHSNRPSKIINLTNV